MVRLLIYGLSLLHLGPGVAFALFSFGCEGHAPFLGALCSKSLLVAFANLTVGAWLVLGMGLVAVHLVGTARRPNAGVALRSFSLLAIVAFGTLVGSAAWALTGTQLFFLAIPASLAIGWLFIANPLACSPVAGAAKASSRSQSAV